MLQAGDPLPDIGATDDTGARVEVRSFVGRPFVVWFYPKADTPG
ncbi:MAG: hypothetical protein ABR591_12045 [Candidatus Velthaea sp.]